MFAEARVAKSRSAGRGACLASAIFFGRNPDRSAEYQEGTCPSGRKPNNSAEFEAQKKR